MTGYTPIYNLPYPEPSDLVSAYPGTGQDLAEEVETVLAAKVAYALPKNAQTGTTYTFVLADANKLVTASNAASSTYTIPPQSSVAWTADTVIRVVNYGAGVVTFAGGSGVTVTNTAATLAQYGSCALVRTASDAWTVVPFSGGASLLKAADVSSTTGSPTITTSGIYTIYKFTASGSITFTRSGVAEALVVAGGGSGGGNSSVNEACGGGGGGGGVIDTSADPSGIIFPAGATTITVGAGGTGTAGAGNNGGNSSIGSLLTATGGGKGGSWDTPTGGTGGSGGGGGGRRVNETNLGGSGTGVQGFGGGGAYSSASFSPGGGGGGGARLAGITTVNVSVGGNGGTGQSSSITGSAVTYGGGGGGSGAVTDGTGGAGGGGNGGATPTSGTANTGGGGGGARNSGATVVGGSGGSGVVIIRVLT